ISRCDSAAIVPKTSELLPEPETPVKAVSRRFGISTLTSLRLLTRAPCTRIRSWLSAACGAGGGPSVLVALRPDLCGGRLVDAHQIARRVAHGEVPRSPRLVGRLLDDVRARGLELLEAGVEVVAVEVDAGEGALGDEGGDGGVVGGAAVEVVRQHDRDVGLRLRADRDPEELAFADVVALLQPQRV